MTRIILHIDCNNAFLSWTAVHLLHNGSKVDIRNKFAVIGGKESERRGIVLAKSNLCKKNGVTTGETLYSARKKCPYLLVFNPEFKIYRKYSDMMYTYLCSYTKKIERYSIDECFLDYTDLVEKFGEPVKVAYKIRDDIKNNFGFTVNVGVGNNKLLAKMASDFSKPNKVHTLFSNEISEKMWLLPVSDLFMIGKASSKKLTSLGIKTIGDLAHKDLEYLTANFKSFGKMMWEYANGIDESNVESEYGNPKSISNSVVLPYNYTVLEEIKSVLKDLSISVGNRLRKKKMFASNVNILVKFDDFSTINKQVMLDNPINSDDDILEHAISLFNSVWNSDSDKKIRSLGVGVSNLTTVYKVQLSIFEKDNVVIKKDDELEKVMDSINSKFGKNMVTFADKIEKKE